MKKKTQPEAESVDHEPSDEPTPAGHGLPLGPDDEPKGHPTSDRFQTESVKPAKSKK